MMSALCYFFLCPPLSTEKQKRERREQGRKRRKEVREEYVCVTNNEGKKKKSQTERGPSLVKSTNFDHGSSSKGCAVAVAVFSLSRFVVVLCSVPCGPIPVLYTQVSTHRCGDFWPFFSVWSRFMLDGWRMRRLSPHPCASSFLFCFCFVFVFICG
ncbi:MAG: hypothetical protein JOS17DRAFT_738553 [Linnemannia elongata]|nr:MAG: hypothetical protein JOS17DRAFT_738553 [Linnemannia elongata]